ncbi:MAG: hemerythrin domain-containing protein, partial [Acidiferrobacterales bacterium]
VEYFLDYPDLCHHPKEDNYLFPALRRRHPGAEPILSELEEQHRHGAVLLDELRKALSAYEFQGAAAYPSFHKSVLAYTKFEYEHARKEERDVFPLALEYL